MSTKTEFGIQSNETRPHDSIALAPVNKKVKSLTTTNMSENDEGTAQSKSILNALLDAVEGGSEITEGDGNLCKPFLRLFKPSKPSEFLVVGKSAKQQQSLLLQSIRTADKGRTRKFFTALKSIIEVVISTESYVPASAFQNDDNDCGSDGVVSDDKSTESLHFLKYAAMCTHAHLGERISQAGSNDASSGKSLQILPQVYDVAVDLHDILLSVHDCGPESAATTNAILSLCEEWWLANANNRDNLVAQVLPLLVLRASDTTELQKAHIKKLLKFKDAFLVIDFMNPSSSSLKSLLLRVASNPLCLKIPEGKKFLASLFRDPDLVSDLYLAFRAQIPQATKTVQQAYGEIFHKAWTDVQDKAEEEAQEAVEQALQDLMYSAIHLSQPAMAQSIITILEPIHADKKSEQVARMLHRLYSPILWRSLSAANPLVRRNAVIVLEKVFPMHNPDHNQMNAAVSKSCSALKAALQDNDVRVRVEGSRAAASICTMYWEALPSADIRMLLNCKFLAVVWVSLVSKIIRHSHVIVCLYLVIVLEHASDSKSAVVRTAALETATTLLATPQSHAVLRPLLPSMGNLIHDKSEKVRLAAVKLLRRVKALPGIRYYHVVPVDHLSSRFSVESKIHRNPRNPVAHEMAALMLNSYLPQGRQVSAADQIQRTMTFLLTDPDAAVGFYANLVDLLDVEAVVKFATMLLSCLKSAVETHQAQKLKDSQKFKKRPRNTPRVSDESSQELQFSAANVSLMASLAEVLYVLVKSVKSSLENPSDDKSFVALCKRFSEVNMVNILRHFEHEAEDRGSSPDEKSNENASFRVCSSILRCISLFPEDSIEGAIEFVQLALAKASERDWYRNETLSYFALLANWGKVEDIAKCLAKSLESAFENHVGVQLLSPCFSEVDKPRRSRRSSANRSVGKELDLPSLPPKHALSVIDSVMFGGDFSSQALREVIFESHSATATLQVALRKGLVSAERLLEMQPVRSKCKSVATFRVRSSCFQAFGQRIKLQEVEFLLSCSELYARFILHKAANMVQGESEEIQELLDWTSSKVLPVLQRSRMSEVPLQDLDLSRISNVSDSLIVPASPEIMSPPRQRANLCTTPNSRLSEASVGSGIVVLSSTVVDAVAKSLLQVSCLAVSEFLAVGADCDGKISRSASDWFVELTKKGTDEELRELGELLPSFLRLCSQLCKTSSSFSLLSGLLEKFNVKASFEQLEMFKKAILYILQPFPKCSNSYLSQVVDAILSAAYRAIERERITPVFKQADSFSSLWSASESSCIGTALEIVAGNKKACPILIRSLVAELLRDHEGGDSNKTMLQAKCVSLLLQNGACNPVVNATLNESEYESSRQLEVRDIIRKLIPTEG